MQRLQRNPEIVWRVEKRRQKAVIDRLEAGEETTDDATVILLISGMMHQLNLLGGMIWTLCDGEHTFAEILAHLNDEFDVEPKVLKADVQDFVDDLMERGWLSYDEFSH